MSEYPIMKIEKLYDFYREEQGAFRCPICHTKMRMRRPASLVCKKNHCYDMSKYGYINFIPHQKQTKYTKELFDSRRIILENGYYQPLEECLQSLISQHFPGKGDLYMLDIGCGEGFYAGSMKERFPEAQIYAFDNSKEAIVMGAKKRADIRWFMGDLTNIPLASESIDVILDLFTPSNYSEFTRILNKEGLLMKVVPGEHYLEELRACIQKTWKKEAYSSRPVVDYFRENMVLEKQITVSYTKEIDQEIAQKFVEMTPMMFDATAADVKIDSLKRLTFEMVILLGKTKK